jgi:hypothetical protein
MSQPEVKYFTPREAQKTLPLVRQIVVDILNSAQQINKISESLNGKVEENKEVLRLSDEIEKFIVELEGLGCSYKDWNFQIGLVDFPSIIEENEVFLCWRSDEEDIRYYHGLLDGYSGRKLIPSEYL